MDELRQVGWRRSIVEQVRSHRHDHATSCQRRQCRPARQSLGLRSLIVKYMDGAESIHSRYNSYKDKTTAQICSLSLDDTLPINRYVHSYQRSDAQPVEKECGSG